MGDCAGGCRVTGQSEGSLINASLLLGCDKDELRKSLVCRTMQATKAGRAGTVIQYVFISVLSFVGIGLLHCIDVMHVVDCW